MEKQYYDFLATRGYCGLWVRRVFFSPLTAGVCLVLLITPGILALRGQYMSLVTMLGLMLWTLYVLNSFLIDELESDDRPPFFASNRASMLSADLIQRCRGRRTIRLYQLLRAIALTKRGAYAIHEIGLKRETFLEMAKKVPDRSLDLPQLITKSEPYFAITHEKRVHAPTLLAILFDIVPELVDILNESDLSKKDYHNIVRLESQHKRIRGSWAKPFHPQALLKHFGSVGRSWVVGYTKLLDQITDDVGTRLQYSDPRDIIIHQDALKEIAHTLSVASGKNNVLITGRPGVGKKTLTENVARLIRQYEISHGQRYTRISALQIESLISGSLHPDRTLLEAFAGLKENMILIVNNLPLLLQACDARLKSVFLKILCARHIRVIGISDLDSYHKLIKNDAGLNSMFQTIMLSDANEEETMGVLAEHYFHLEDTANMTVTYKALKSVYMLSKRYIGKVALPGKAIEVIDDALLVAQEQSLRYVREEQVRNVVSRKSNINIQSMGEEERYTLLNLEEKLKKQIIGQDEAVSGVVHALKRARMEIGGDKKPYGTFLFLGSTGVGKTHTAKTIASELFGEGGGFIRLDMNEYSTEQSVADVIGTAMTEEGFLTQRVQDNPFSLILLDEIEKAHKKVLNLFLQVLDEGFMSDWRGMQTDFRNTIMIATSNAGSGFIHDFVTQHGDWNNAEGREKFHDELLEHILHRQKFSPEFLNRFDQVIVYYPLTKDDAVRVAHNMIKDLSLEFKEKKGIAVDIGSDALDAIVEKGYSVEFGAREIHRTIVDQLENFIADTLLDGKIKRGSTLTVHREDLSL